MENSRRVTKSEIEQRSGAAWATGLRVLPGDKTGPGYLEWYPIIYNSLSEDLGGFREVVLPGSLTKTLQKADVRALINHSADRVLGRTKAGTLTLTDTARGILARAELPNTSWAADLAESVRRGDINEGSFAFRMVRERWGSVGGETLRELVDLDLVDVSIVTFPAYPATAGAAIRARLARSGKRVSSKVLQARRRWLDIISKQ